MDPHSNDENLAARIEAFLFSEGGAMTLHRLSRLTGVAEKSLKPALEELERRFEGRGITLVRSDTEVSLVTAASVSDEVRAAHLQELNREIGDAGLEVLSIVLYRGPSTRSEIDYIRGVNTSSTIRTLLARGLVERAGNPEDAREYVYRPTVELLAHLGVKTAHELQDYATISSELKAFEQTHSEQHNATATGTIDTDNTAGNSAANG